MSPRRIRRLMAWCGISRLADLTGLDRLNLHVIAAVRPLSQSLSVASGKGITRSDALMSALMEAYEHAAAEATRPSIRMLSAEDAAAAPDCADPALLPRDRRAPEPANATPWVAFERIDGHTPLWLPEDLVHLRLTVPDMNSSGGYLISTNGLAAALDADAATLHALCEVVERDAIACALDERGCLRLDRYPPLVVEDVMLADAGLGTILSKIMDADVDFTITDITHDIGISVVHCRLTERASLGKYLAPPCDGVGCAPTPVEAVRRAITEAAQARSTLVSGMRDDILRRTYRIVATPSNGSRPGARPLDALPEGPGIVSSALDWVMCKLADRGMHDASVLTLDSREGAVALRVVVPGLDGVPMSAGYMPGKRARAAQSNNATFVADRARQKLAPATPKTTVVRQTRPIVFLGPSLSRKEALQLLDADYRPPASQGDLYLAARARPPVIALIDGSFLTGPSVWHKEIIWALSQGVPVWGAASMGALRAAELEEQGMQGIGAVFEAYRRGFCLPDDHVAVQYAPAELGFSALTTAAVDMANALEGAFSEGVIDTETKADLIAAMYAMHFTERTWHALFLHANREGIDGEQISALIVWLKSSRSSLKSNDARTLLHHIAGTLASDISVVDRPPTPDTLLWHEMVARVENPFLRDLL